jgi:hypothetical protein
MLETVSVEVEKVRFVIGALLRVKVSVLDCTTYYDSLPCFIPDMYHVGGGGKERFYTVMIYCAEICIN